MSSFQFSQPSLSQDGSTLNANWAVTADAPMFAGHFPGMPIMPAVAQIALLQALIRQHSPWSATIIGGSGLKFSGRIQPGDLLNVRLQRTDTRAGTGVGSGVDNGVGTGNKPGTGSVRFSIANQAGPTSKGLLTLSSEGDGEHDG